MDKPLLAFLGVLLLFSLGNSADAFLLLRLSDASAAPLTCRSSGPAFMSSRHRSRRGGELSRTGSRRHVIVIGWLLYALVYVGFAMAESAWTLVGWFLVYGAFFALTEGAEKALVADLAPADKHGGVRHVQHDARRWGLAASVVFGLLCERFGAPAAFSTGAVLATLAAVLLMALRPSSQAGKMVGSNGSNSSHQ